MGKKRKIGGVIGAIVVGGLGIFLAIGPGIVEKQRNAVRPHAPWPASAEAQALHKTLFIGDWHTDSLLWNRDLLERGTYGQADVPRWDEGNVGIQVLTAVTKSPSGQNYEHNATDAHDNITLLAVAQLWPPVTWTSLLQRALYQARKLHGLVERAPKRLAVIRTQRDLEAVIKRRAAGERVLGTLLGIEGGHPLEGNLANVDTLFEAGYRLIGITHFFDNELGGSLHGQSNAGLTDFGKAVVQACIKRGIVVDVAHASPQVAEDVLKLDPRPIVVSHTGIRSHCDTKRNFPDALMKRIAKHGGVIAIGFWKDVTCDDSPKGVVAAISAAVKLVGENHVSLGSDYDGSVPVAFDASELAAVTHEMLAAGYSPERIRKIMGGNMVRVLRAALPK
ncbi:MAG: dipeptidase [Myxococcales bacterium]|nr:dipeptidase [Myxococcales bacterium]